MYTNTQVTRSAVISKALLSQILTQAEPNVQVLIETYTKDYARVVADIEALGGEVTFQYKYATGLAAKLPANKVFQLAENLNVKAMFLDEKRSISARGRTMIDGEKSPKALSPMFNIDEFDQPRDMFKEQREGILGEYTLPKDAPVIHLTPEQIELLEPQTYWNPIAMGAGNVWAMGDFGQDSLAVIIDTGVYADHIMLGWYPDGPVIGGVDMSYDAGDPTYGGFDNWRNHWHGTHVAGILAGAAGILVHSSDPLYKALAQHGAPPPQASSMGYPGYHVIPCLGMAPAAQIYGIKVFDHTGGGVPESMIINAIDYAIWMHEEGGYDVDIISMSLGGGTGYDGRDLEDQTVDYATSIGITVVASAGNAGPASMTVGSPGTAHTAITVGAAAHPVNTRVYWDLAYGQPGIGHQLFTSKTPQVFYYSSRGPTSDGRDKPTVTATGILVFSAVTPPSADPGATNWFGWASGTSMAAPAVSGGVALLNTWGEMYGASPYDYKEAVIDGAVWLEGYDSYDQGAGYLNAGNSLIALMNDPSLGDLHPAIPPIPGNAPVPPKGINTGIVGSGTYTYTITDLQPGYVEHFYFEATAETDSITVEISDVETVRNPLLINTFELHVQSAVRSGYDYFIDSANVWGDAVFHIEDYSTTWSGATWLPAGGDASDQIIQPGYMRVVLENDWTSSGRISGTIEITVTETSPPPPTPDQEYSGDIDTGEWWPAPPWGGQFVSFGTSGVIVELWWENDWTEYPTSDLDMYILWNDGASTYLMVSGASLRSPEGVYIDSPDINWVMVLIYGYETYGITEPWTLKVYNVG
jgi:subtilisin family serine protease